MPANIDNGDIVKNQHISPYSTLVCFLRAGDVKRGIRSWPLYNHSKTMMKKTTIACLGIIALFLCNAPQVWGASSDDPLRPGDLLFFWTSEKGRHVGIYLEDGKFFHSSTTSGVTISNMDEDYWRYRLITIRRVDHGLSLAQLRKGFARYDRARYGYGKAGPDRFDCSGLVWRVFNDHGIDLPRSTRRQIRVGKKVAKA